MEWVELILPAGESADEVAALLLSLPGWAWTGAQVRENDVVLWVPLEDADAATDALRQAASKIAEAGFAVDPGAVRCVAAVPEAEWRDAWKRYFHVTRLTRRIVIVPSWESYTPHASDIVLDLDPGRAFGTGAHASTKLCLRELERLCDDSGLLPARFLDVGTGSGILSIAAAKLWPRSTGVAVDIDPQAVSAAEENLERNSVLERVRASGDALDEVEGVFDVVVANIQADVLEDLAGALVAHLAPGGALLLSGLLSEQADPVAKRFEQAGLPRVRISTLEDDPAWSAVVLGRFR